MGLLSALVVLCLACSPAVAGRSLRSLDAEPGTELNVSSAGAATDVVERTTPVIDSDVADPYVLTADGRYYAFSTNARGDNVPVWVSTDLVHWTALDDALPNLPEWAQASGMTWAPSVVARGDHFVMYLTVNDAVRGVQCIVAATSALPNGQYVLTSDHPLQCAEGGSIDASPFVDGGGDLWLLWKDEPTGGEPARIVVAPLDSSGLEFKGTATTLISEDAVGDVNVEAPSMVKTKVGYRLFFSIGDWKTSGYSTGFADCTRPNEGCVVAATRWLSEDNGLDGPGGLEVFAGLDGETYVAFHTWAGCTTCSDRYRALRIRHLTDLSIAGLT